MKIDQLTLQNNLKTVFINVPSATAASIQIWFRAGSALEEKDHEGIAHFLEHMFFKGTKDLPGPALTKEIESFGGEVNAFTSFDYTCYYINAPVSYIHKSVQILLDMVCHPEFKADDIPAERGVVFEEYRRSLDNPQQFSFMQLQQHCFTKGYAHPILGREETIQNFSREQLIYFRQKFYNLTNALLVVAGNLEHRAALVSEIEKFHLPEGPSSTFPTFNTQDSPVIQIHQKDVKMCQLILNLDAPSYLHPQASAEDLAINCLGHGETSRLYQELVLKTTFANNTSASTMYFAHGGAHFIKLSFPPQNFSKVLKTFHQTLSQIYHEGFKEDEIKKIKNQYIASKVYEKESIESLAFSLGHGFAQNGNIHCEEEFIESIKKAPLYEVNKSFKKIFTSHIHFNLQIPMSEKEKTYRKGLEDLRKLLQKLEGTSSKKTKANKSHNAKKTKTSQGITKKFKITKIKEDPQLSIINFSNGIKLLHRQNDMTPTSVLQTYIKGGLGEEKKETSGYYNMISGLLTKGYDKISYEKIKQNLEENSASLSGFAGKNSYGLNFHCQTEHFYTLLPHFFGALHRPDFLEKHLKHEKEICLRIIESQKVDPVKQCFKAVNQLFFHQHPYSLDLIGSPQSIKKMKRTELLKLHQQNLNKKEMVFTYCGDLPLDSVIEILEPHLTQLPSRKKQAFKKYKQKTTFNHQEHIKFNREQTQIFMGLPAFHMSDARDSYLKVLTTYLSGQSSELFVEVRDRKGLCYSVQPIHFSAALGGYWGIYMASGHDKVEEAFKAITHILSELQTKGLPQDEFDRVKKMMEGQNLLGLQTNEDYASTYSIPELYHLGADYFYRNNQTIHQMKLDDFNAFLKKFLAKKINTIAVGR